MLLRKSAKHLFTYSNTYYAFLLTTGRESAAVSAFNCLKIVEIVEVVPDMKTKK